MILNEEEKKEGGKGGVERKRKEENKLGPPLDTAVVWKCVRRVSDTPPWGGAGSLPPEC